MNDFPVFPDLNDLPAPSNPEWARAGRERWADASAASGDPEIALFAESLLKHAETGRILDAIFGNSPFLTQCAVRDPAFFREILTAGPAAAHERAMTSMSELLNGITNREEFMAALRRLRLQVALSVAVADIARLWDVDEVTAALSDFADTALAAATHHLLAPVVAAGDIVVPDRDDPSAGSGYIVLGVGKLGAGELNYSSDIDLIVLYDDAKIRARDGVAPGQLFVRLTRDLVTILSERTADGYVFRTDLRLRPDPSSTPAALSVVAAETYYESVGQNWERAAMIRARPVAGDSASGAIWMARLRPFIWRKHLDFETIQDIHAIKRQIYAQYGGADIAVEGHNIKLGRGGIREIEFFAQTQQLIFGGRDPSLRSPRTCDALAALADAGHVTRDAADDLSAAYRFLRRLEHRLQMVDDQQTHTLPDDPEKLVRLAVFMGHEGADGFRDELLHHLRLVETHYADLFEETPDEFAPAGIPGNLLFTGEDDDPDTLKTLSGLGFAAPSKVSATIRAWHRARRRATQTLRARQLLTELMPVILVALGKTPDPDATFAKFDDFLSALPAGVQLFSMLRARPELLDLVAEVLGTAPRLADQLNRNPQALEGLLDASFAEPLPDAAALTADLGEFLDRARDYEELLDLARRWANDLKLRVGIQLLRNVVDGEQAARNLSDIADAALSCLVPRVEADFAATHGRVAGSGLVVLALGKLGSREMTPTSDLDLIFVYDHEDVPASDGAKPLSPGPYFARLSQRIIGAVTAATPEGKLYDVDMRLRPSGSAGPIASSLEAFRRYHEDKAWTWEHMALSRARTICGPEELRGKVEGEIARALTAPRDTGALVRDVADMRARIDREFGTDFVWETKYVRGGLVDIEFAVQFLQLRHAKDHPEILSPNNREALDRLATAGVIDAGLAAEFTSALDLWHAVQAILRLTIQGFFKKERQGEVPDALKTVIARAAGAQDFATLETRLHETASRIHNRFIELIEAPAEALTTKN
jgi:glutamate-ammonia-ligase adenylyltransferase